MGVGKTSDLMYREVTTNSFKFFHLTCHGIDPLNVLRCRKKIESGKFSIYHPP